MSMGHIRETLVNILSHYSYGQAMAAGSLSSFMLEFITNRGQDLLFVFFAGILGALAGGLTKWALERTLFKGKANKEPYK